MKKTASVLLSVGLLLSIFTGSASAAEGSNVNKEKRLITTIQISLNDQQRTATLSDSQQAELSVFEENGKKIYEVKGAKTPDEKRRAFEILNNYMEKGTVQQATVTVNKTGYDFYGNEYGYSSANRSAMGYTWAKYNAGKGFANNSNVYDKTWGGQSASWTGSNNPSYIKLLQSVTVNVSNASSTLTIGWPPSYSVTPTRTSSTASWSSDSTSGVTVLGAEHQTTQINRDDVQRGKITSLLYSDSADVKVGSTIYRPTNSVRFTNGL
ncbi:hypothetical protein Q9R46_18270 [Paenibacillus sp. RRE4]|uniref:hypothetical protein n=1 Tax=Paenibacillus sp. RRE4 TaxID=2962587 RepID=UPI002881A30C|nr:hypothetical protein [Paenibacillus sp. RRE4]MDT0124614.1 hypothetical protein [Paenibacillus sp. RRE4]